MMTVVVDSRQVREIKGGEEWAKRSLAGIRKGKEKRGTFVGGQAKRGRLGEREREREE